MSVLVAFLTEAGTRPDGLDHAGVLGQDDDWFETRHDFIQWLFPLTEPSRAVPGAPVLTAAEAARLRAEPRARRRMLAATRRMEGFYARTDAWLAAHDHNHLRITRIIRSLRLLVDDAAADAFRAFILDQLRARGGRVNADSLRFWAAA